MTFIEELKLLKLRHDKAVICIRCLKVYDLNLESVLVKTKGLKEKERACPRCECKVYYS
ncbi:hypothetical protein PS2_114 [Serratia phage PS2]|uniref:Uncharacterized protein n=1 Tax=Serratia phage PS2 TaxID=1481112 RepID=A0A023W525_9CAUD|nr:hypothetical protein FF83_gp114 [Serratia phage PS2]AHY25360.1 hypothetical protein PS2_114 [Serratia phage PS2]